MVQAKDRDINHTWIGTGESCHGFPFEAMGDSTKHTDTREEIEGFEYRSRGVSSYPLGNRSGLRFGAESDIIKKSTAKGRNWKQKLEKVEQSESGKLLQ